MSGEDASGRPHAGVRFGAAATVAGLVAALSLPGNRVGLNLMLTAAAVACAVTLARPRALSLEAVVLAAAALLFAAVAVVRDASWVVAIDACFGAGLALLAVTGASSWAAMATESLRALVRLPGGVRYAAAPLYGYVASRRWERAGPIARGGLIGAGLLIVFGTLFVTADRAFAQMARDAVSMDVDLALVPARVVVAVVALAATGALASSGPRAEAGVRTPALLRLLGRDEEPAPAPPRGLGRAEWIVPLVLLDLLFAAFVAVQVAVLFGGERHVLDTAGLTYAQYARSGFFQLCAVGAGALAVVAGAVRWSRGRTPADRVLLRVLLGALLVLTLVVLVSALRRLTLYEVTYGYTRLRISVHATILWLGGVIVLVMAAGIRLRGRWLPRAVIAFTAVALMTFTATNPDAVIARANVDRFEDTGRIDLAYLSTLSADATAALSALPADVRACVLADAARRLDDGDSWVSFNVARARARATLETVSPGERVCPRPSLDRPPYSTGRR